MVRYFPERMGTLLGLVFLDTNHSEEVPCVHLYQSPKLGTTVIGHSSFHLSGGLLYSTASGYQVQPSPSQASHTSAAARSSRPPQPRRARPPGPRSRRPSGPSKPVARSNGQLIHSRGYTGHATRRERAFSAETPGDLPNFTSTVRGESNPANGTTTGARDVLPQLSILSGGEGKGPGSAAGGTGSGCPMKK